MDYLGIVQLVFGILTGTLSLLLVHFVVFGVLGVFGKKRFPKTEEKLKYGVIIPARNEEAVVGNLIESVRKCKYPQENLHIFVIAHNCTDNTAAVCRAFNDPRVSVYEYNNPDECTMGYAFKHLFQKIEEDFGTQSFDGFFLFNADNILDENFFDKMNNAFVAEGRTNIITSMRNSKNFGSNIISALYGVYFMSGCVYESRGRTLCGCSTRVQGTGYVIPAKLVENGWQYVTLTEDWEFSTDQILQGNKIVYCDEAVFYDEQPTTLKITCRQRIRWAKGHLLVCVTRFKALFRGLFCSRKNGGAIHKGSTYDISVNILPVCVISTALLLAQIILTVISPLLGADSAQVISFLFRSLFSLASSYLMTAISALVLFILERKRIKGVKLGLKIAAILLWPIFIALSIPFEYIALFKKNVGWKTIPHTDTTKFDAVNETKDASNAEEALAAANETETEQAS